MVILSAGHRLLVTVLGRETRRLTEELRDPRREAAAVRGAVMFGPGDVRVVERDEPRLIDPTDAIIRVSASCVCGSDLWPYRGVESLDWPAPMGHEYVGIVEEVGGEVETGTSASSASVMASRCPGWTCLEPCAPPRTRGGHCAPP